MVKCSCGANNLNNAKYCNSCGKCLDPQNHDISKKSLLNTKNSLKYWIILLCFFILGINIIFFGIYRMAIPNSNPYLQVWNYIQSTGLVIIISILLPLFKLFYDRNQELEKKNETKENTLKEEQKQKQIESIETTQKCWKMLIKTTNQISDITLESRTPEIKKIIHDLDDLKESSYIVKSGYYYFDKLSNQEIKYNNYLLKPFNILLLSALSVILFIKNNPRNDVEGYNKWLENEILERQYSLEIIERAIREIYHIAILTVLNNYILVKYNQNQKIQNEITEKLKLLEDLFNWQDILEKNDEQKLYENYLLMTMQINQNVTDFEKLKESYKKVSNKYKDIESHLADEIFKLIFADSKMKHPKNLPLIKNTYSKGLIIKMANKFEEDLNKSGFPNKLQFMQVQSGLYYKIDEEKRQKYEVKRFWHLSKEGQHGSQDKILIKNKKNSKN